MKRILQKRFPLLIKIIFSILISWLVFHVPEEEFDVPRMQWLYLATLTCLFYIAYLRGINVKDYKAWVFLVVGGAVLLIYWKAKAINAESYGEVYSETLKLRHICYMFSVGLLFDLIRHKPIHIKHSIKSPLLWVYILFAGIAVFFVPEDAIPVMVPLTSLILTDIDNKKWTEIVDCFGAGYYLVFFKMFTASLISLPLNFVSGRYMGAFRNTSTTGIHVAIAVIVGLYFFIRWLWSEKKSKKKLIVLLLLWIYPIVVSIMVNSRSSEFGLLGSLLVAFVFLHGKGKATTDKRIKIGAVICLVAVGGVIGLGYFLHYLRVIKIIDGLPYGLDHIALIGSSYEDGYFDSAFLNKLNAFSSQRLIDWVELIKQASFKGTDAELLYTHNVYIFYIIKYGFIGGGLVVLWAATYFVQGIVCSYKHNPAFIMSILYGSFALLSEIGMNGYWMLPLGFYWLLLSYPLITYIADRKRVENAGKT